MIWEDVIEEDKEFERNLMSPFIQEEIQLEIFKDLSNPNDFSSLFIEEKFLKMIAEFSNEYAKQYSEQLEITKKEKCVSSWGDGITLQDIKRFLALSLLTGIIKLPSIKDYWCKRPSIHISFFSSQFSRYRFIPITRFLHFANTVKPL